MKRHTQATKPTLTDANKYARMKFALSFIKADMQMKDMHEYVHLDEKWFYLVKENEKFYLAPDEPPPKMTRKSKRFVTKVMFLVAVARPRYLDKGKWWDGKIGFWAFTEKVQAARSSRNRPAGTLVTTTINVTKDVYRTVLVDKVLPRIVEIWPHKEFGTRIRLQHDNARSHVSPDDANMVAEFAVHAENDWFFSIDPQPANSPDTNVLDLGFFASIQSLQHQHSPRTMDELIDVVLLEFAGYPMQRLSKIWLSFQLVLLEILKCDGGNDFKLPHASKDKMSAMGRLPDEFVCDLDVFNAARAKIIGADQETMMAALSTELVALREEDEMIQLLEELDLAVPDNVELESTWEEEIENIE